MILGLLATQNAEGSSKLHSTYPEEHFGIKLTKKISTLLFFSRKISDIWRDILSWMSKLPSTCPEEKHIEVTEIWENRIFFSFFGIRSECFKLLHENCEQSLQTAFDLSSRPIRTIFFLKSYVSSFLPDFVQEVLDFFVKSLSSRIIKQTFYVPRRIF